MNDLRTSGSICAETVPLTLGALIDCYQSDPDSPYHKLEHATRGQYRKMGKALKELAWDDNGTPRTGADTRIDEIKARVILRWHKHWLEQGKVPMAHAVIAQLRIITGFGRTILENTDCARLSDDLKHMRFPMAKPRTAALTAAQVIKIREMAHALGNPSIALAQAIQFELILRQKDVIGELLPLTEPGLSAVIVGRKKWVKGVRWEEIDENLVLTHVTSKRKKKIAVNLTNAPMVMEELRKLYGPEITRDRLPAAGPIVVKANGRPYDANDFRVLWRQAATAAGVPKDVRNMDTRAGAITEATDAGAPLEHVRVSATHSDIQMTQKYSRGDQDKIASVQSIRAEHRSKNK